MKAQRNREGVLALLLAAVILAVDQYTKLLAQQNLDPSTGHNSVGVIGDFLRFTYTTNSGAVFGILPNMTTIFIIVAFLAIPLLIVVQRLMPIGRWPTWVSIGLMLGGNIGNLLDRLRWGHVTDFINFGIGDVRWYVFNVADAAFFIGVAILAIYWLFFVEEPQNKNAAQN